MKTSEIFIKNAADFKKLYYEIQNKFYSSFSENELIRKDKKLLGLYEKFEVEILRNSKLIEELKTFQKKKFDKSILNISIYSSVFSNRFKIINIFYLKLITNFNMEVKARLHQQNSTKII